MDKAKCSVSDCDRPIHGRGYCVRHYTYFRRNGFLDTSYNKQKKVQPTSLIVVSCPDDEENGKPLYSSGAMFSRQDFMESLVGSVWPDGMVVRNMKKEKFVIKGNRLVAI